MEETSDPEAFIAGTIAHSQIGHNTDPKSKLDMFYRIATSGGAEKADIMFFKFCYVDFNSQTDVSALFEIYRNTLEQLKNKYVQTTFIHLTTPLTTIQSGIKAWIKKIVGRSVSGEAENIKRHEFNEMIRKAYLEKEPVFDLAKIESTFPDGRRATFNANKNTYYYLVPEFTTDGGHLNNKGKKAVAEQLLIFLINIVKNQ